MANHLKLNSLCGAGRGAATGLAFALALSACTTTAPKPAPTAATPPADSALVSQIMAAEMAFKSDQIDAAAEGYTDAAQASPDPQVAERATRIAMFAKRYELVERAAARWLKLDANANLARQALASAAIHRNDRTGALKQLRLLLALDVSPKQRWQSIGEALIGHRESALTGPILETLLGDRHAGDDLDSRLSQAQLAQALGLEARALTLADDAVARHATSERALLFRGQLKLEQKSIDAGLADHAAALALKPTDRALQLGYAALLSQHKRAGDADRVLATMPQDQEVLLTRAAYADEAGDRTSALKHYRSLSELKPENRAEHAWAVGQLAEELALYSDALKWYSRVDLGENIGAARVRQAVVMHKSGRSAEALALLKRLQVESEDPQIIEAAYLFEAEMASERQDATAEFAVLDRGLAALSNSPQLLYARALKLVEAKRIDEAERDLRRIIGLDPEAAYALNALGYTLADLTDRYTEAREYIERALKLTPNEPAVIDSMGWVLFRLGKTDQALEYLKRAYALSPDPEIAAHLGEVLIASGARDEGEKILREAAKDKGPHPVLDATIKRLGVAL
jgi:tetratricopeptide (TPR) repeat protein